MNIQLIKNETEMPDNLVPNAIIMNGMDFDIPLGFITSFTGIKVGTSLLALKKFAENCDCVGALLSYDGEKYTIWNGDNTLGDYWDPHAYNGSSCAVPSTKYGTVLAVCAGKGLWPVLNWKGHDSTQISVTINGNSNTLRKGYMCFASKGSNMFNTYISKLIRGEGYENTKHLFDNFGVEIAGWNHTGVSDGDVYASWNDYYAALIPLWEQLTKTNIDGIKTWKLDSSGNVTQYGNLYIPNSAELQTVWRNCVDNNDGSTSGDGDDLDEDSYGCYYNHNIGRLFGLSYGYYYWSSSQYPDDYSRALCVNFGNGYVEDDAKGSYCLSVACLHFI